MVAMLAFGGTYAYFTAVATPVTSGTVTMGKVQLSTTAASAFTATYANTMPGDTILGGGVTLSKEESSEDIWVAVKIEISNEDLATALGISTALGDGWEESATAGIFVKKAKLSASETILSEGVELDKVSLEDTWTQGGNTDTLMGQTVTITVSARAMQGKNVEYSEAKTVLPTLF